ncbi:MAG TPA: prenyltransferase/squalene oxidase repeat-containing protein [Prolixibacteraceae bacterium]|nr:prenyltransferase/squalene oxidase repeat-containing protein [Prolixibacteraceae bacterium]
MSASTHIPYYRQIIELLVRAFSLLDEEGRAEVIGFVMAEQNPDGGFKDRAGRSDLYYSLFGMMIFRAAEKAINDQQETGNGVKKANTIKNYAPGITSEQEEKGSDAEMIADAIKRLKEFTKNKSAAKVPGFIERCCQVLLQKELRFKRFSRLKSFLSLGSSFWKERSSINMSYRSFVLFLTIDAVLSVTGVIRRSARRMLTGTTLDEQSPCSEVAAKVFMRKIMNQKDSVEEEILASFACSSGGFKAFMHLYHPDMLSTAVALYALNHAGADLRLLRPSCLDFIQSNYSGGAFLSGDGDTTADVEYTFYGLLALGVLAE